ncbi:DNA helicase [Pedobacter quisquiliarum]|jgi:DNA helicase-2/ATP-dependent DNA helicase PcrA|uniref:DNA 3'-5' helicase II n=1 Tax=Pedobacter quisquiliarum TaxID=1834438 RepID=A0A916UL86_9SPHI|nr:UvrD-helicase domain-containing protein [Pedobacter quisquiliarum]GGC75783.1 DNA helicase [Pedobacter quisquiliarum]
MGEFNAGNDRDAGVDDQIFSCLNPDSPKSFFLFAGAGSGKTRSLVNVLTRFKELYGEYFKLRRQKVAVITYTNAACDEIIHRLDYDMAFHVSTIHSFSWELISHLTSDIKAWLRINLTKEIAEIAIAQGKSKNLMNKTSVERARKIESKTRRLNSLPNILRFTYNPNGDNLTKDSLNHSEVIAITADFIENKHLMQDIVACRFPIILVDESQDTKKDLIDALFALQKRKSKIFSLGLFGDTMQRIYSDGKENLDKNLPTEWITPSKVMNHRSNKRIINLVNDIRKTVDNQIQVPRPEKQEGIVKFFISTRDANKAFIESEVAKKMAIATNDPLWSLSSNQVKMLILEHHMAARRMGFFEFFEPLYEQDKIKTGLLDGSNSTIGFFTRIILPLIKAHQDGDKFTLAKIVKSHSLLLQRNKLIESNDPSETLKLTNRACRDLCALWNGNQDPSLMQIVRNIEDSGLFPIPEALYPLASNNVSSIKSLNEEDEEISTDTTLKAWERALEVPFSQIVYYERYLSEKSNFGTHQGVKGLEYSRVMVIIDDEEAKGFLFSYDKLFGSRELSPGDQKNMDEGKETGIDRTKRLFYVACSRAKDSLAIVAYSDNPVTVKLNLLKYGWFKESEVEIINDKIA